MHFVNAQPRNRSHLKSLRWRFIHLHAQFHELEFARACLCLVLTSGPDMNEQQALRLGATAGRLTECFVLPNEVGTSSSSSARKRGDEQTHALDRTGHQKLSSLHPPPSPNCNPYCP